MAKKKNDESDKPSEEQLLQAKVDAMMDPNRPDQAANSTLEPASADKTPPAIDIFAELKTAPTVAPDMLKGVEPEEKPVKKSKTSAVKKPLKLQPIEPITSPEEEPSENKAVEVEDEKTKDESSVVTTEVSIDKSDMKSEVKAKDEPAKEPESLPNADLDDPETDKAVDDIVRSEADQLLAADDRAAKHTVTKEAHRRVWPWILLAILLVAVGFYAHASGLVKL